MMKARAAAKGARQPTVAGEVHAIQQEEACGVVEALTTFGLRAVLAGLSRSAPCREQLVLKGGTALRLRHGRSIGRVSTDIDLSHIDGAPTFDPGLIVSDVAVVTARVLAETFADAASVQIRLEADRSQPKYPELPAMYVFRLHARATLDGRTETRADGKAFLLELVLDEYVDRTLLEDLTVVANHMPIDLKAYAPVQAMAEKLRALLQKLQHYERTKNQGSFQPRHVFDLALLYDQLRPGDIDRLKPLFDRKCDVRLVPSGERTRERLLHPKLHEAVLAGKNPTHATAAWNRLAELASVVCP